LLIFVHECGHFFAAKLFNVKVNDFAIGMGPSLVKFGKKETKYSLRLFPFGGYVAMEGENATSDNPRNFQNKKNYEKIIISAAGSICNFLLGFIVLFIILLSQKSVVVPVVDQVLTPTTAAEQCALLPGDKILAMNGHSVLLAGDVVQYSVSDMDGVNEIKIRRDGKVMSVSSPVVAMQNNVGDIVPGIGIALTSKVPTIFDRVAYTGKFSLHFVRVVIFSVRELVGGRVKLNDVSGPVGIVSEMVEEQKENTTNFWLLFAFIAINLAVMNLLPLPALDGGRIIFILIGIVYTLFTKKKLNQKIEAIINGTGLVLLLGFSAVILINDIVKLIK